MKITVIDSTNFKADGGAVFGVIPKSMWIKHVLPDENNMCNLSNRCLLIDNGEYKLLVDTGIGDKQDEKYFSHFYLNGPGTIADEIRKHGYLPEEITDILFTHLHWDHCGGALKFNDDKTKTEHIFPNARYHVSKSQWEWANNPNKREKAAYLKENIEALSEDGRLNFVSDSQEILPEITVRIFNGHTIGMTIPFIKSPKGTIVFTADLIPSAIHIPIPWLASYDIQPMVAIREKEDLLIEAAEKNYILFFEHDSQTEACTVEMTPKGVKVKDRISLHQ